jgi:hypothetical protein
MYLLEDAVSFFDGVYSSVPTRINKINAIEDLGNRIGVPSYFGDENTLLNCAPIAEACLDMINNSNLRQSLLEAGFRVAMASGNTRNFFTKIDEKHYYLALISIKDKHILEDRQNINVIDPSMQIIGPAMLHGYTTPALVTQRVGNYQYIKETKSNMIYDPAAHRINSYGFNAPQHAICLGLSFDKIFSYYAGFYTFLEKRHSFLMTRVADGENTLIFFREPLTGVLSWAAYEQSEFMKTLVNQQHAEEVGTVLDKFNSFLEKD